ncbi:hypothetical protein CROQUDRAFT_63792 [Cronartium quercuum f. sp. fusiforme G11]|uniref:Glycosyl transferase CAP10 domain-containing protein n=1 Tax=Cronartium quercuum f. sp. fusiforme G11 TaxID=708437 RepID=A0A9P6NK93_9BASI|nr:hypothetical protein CROQUDRAFT_63792 [Cronartium quercuum f. sp. fusiforme G11]
MESGHTGIRIRFRLKHLLGLTLFSSLFLSSLFILAINRKLIPSPPIIPSIDSNLHRSAKNYKNQWFDYLHELPSNLNLNLRITSLVPFSTLYLNSIISKPIKDAPHPILPLLLSARSNWKSILSSQPTTLEQAREFYIKTYYPLRPPPGFNEWYEFSKKRNFTLINQFESLMEDLKPFREISVKELNRRTKELSQISGITLIKLNLNQSIEIKSNTGRLTPGNAIKDMLTNILKDSNWNFGSIEFALNEKSQARVLPKKFKSIYDHGFDFLTESARNLSAELDPEKRPSLEGFKPEWGKDGNVWDAYRRACPPGSAARRLVETVRSAESHAGPTAAGGGTIPKQQVFKKPTRRREFIHNELNSSPPLNQLTFLDELESSNSFCDRPSTHHLHSTFFTDQRSIEHLYPLFSASKPKGFSDILIPSHYHYHPPIEFTYDSSRNETKWEQKISKLYWHGILTRGANTPPGHMSSFQKQRLVKIVTNQTQYNNKLNFSSNQNAEIADRILLSITSNLTKSLKISSNLVNPLLFDIGISCDIKMGECQNLIDQGFIIKPPSPLSDSYNFKLVLDLDEVGFSPRFGALMESESVVLKMSIQNEFWRDWIQAWIHFIPLSSAFSELHNLLSFFLGLPESLTIKKNYQLITKSLKNPLINFDFDKELRRIGKFGQNWKRRHMRKEDMEVYLFRLLIEWSRIISEPNNKNNQN